MKLGRRIFFHPVLAHPRSRFIFLFYLVFSSILGTLCWLRVADGLMQAGVTTADIADGHPFLTVLLGPYFRWALFFVASWVAAGVTAHRVVGPIERMESWLSAHLKKGPAPAPFKLRKEDPYYKLVLLLTRYLKSN